MSNVISPQAQHVIEAVTKAAKEQNTSVLVIVQNGAGATRIEWVNMSTGQALDYVNGARGEIRKIFDKELGGTS